jgi:predicted ester cyclase
VDIYIQAANVIEGDPEMSLEENKALARRYFEDAPNNPDVCDEIFAPSFQFHDLHHLADNSEMTSTPQTEKDAYEHHKLIWGAWRATVDEILAEGDKVVVRWTHYVTHKAEYCGLPATGKKLSWSGICIFRIADGKIAEVWDIADRLWLWQQLGVLPELKQAIAKATDTMQSALR